MGNEIDNPSKLIDQKPLEGKNHYQLVLYQVETSDVIHNVRVCLAGVGNNVVFGGAAAELIPADHCRKFFDRIRYEEDFHRYSAILERLLLKKDDDQ